jgi:hypothetical protein
LDAAAAAGLCRFQGNSEVVSIMVLLQRRRTRWAAGLALLVGLAGGPALAQKMYRCGSNYQDRPCSGQDSRVISRSGAGQDAPAAAPVDAACARRAADAQKVAWVRETGKTEAEQVAAQPGQRELIAQVYRRRGSSVDIRNGIEAECVAEKERAAQAAALLESALKQGGGAKAGESRAVR